MRTLPQLWALGAGLVALALTVAPAAGASPDVQGKAKKIKGFTYLAKNAQGYREYRHDQTDIVFVLLPKGRFWMGSPEDEAGSRKGEHPRHRVALDSFLIAKYEVSQAQWKKVMGDNPSKFEGDALPVEKVSWNECQEFCRKTGLSLPTEAQWEYACRGGTETPFVFGEKITTDQVNYGIAPSKRPPDGEYREKTLPVDALQPNGFGLHHVHGNVEEWCQDFWDPGFYGSKEATKKDPECTKPGDLHVVRGGSWFHDSDICRSAFRGPHPAKSRFPVLGLRPVHAAK